MANNNNWIKAQNLSRYYQRGPQQVRAVDTVNFGFEKGDFVAIVGASGSGKSTLLNLLAGLDTPTSGEIEFQGNTLTSLSEKQLSEYRARKVGMVFQSFNLLKHFNALDNVSLALYFNDTPIKQRAGMAQEVLKKLGMADRLDHLPGSLSGGEQQRVALARALVKKPELLLADEPTGNLDEENSCQIARLLKELNTEGLTVVLVTHDLDLAQHCARRIIRMHYGQVVDDSPNAASFEEEV